MLVTLTHVTLINVTVILLVPHAQVVTHITVLLTFLVTAQKDHIQMDTLQLLLPLLVLLLVVLVTIPVIKLAPKQFAVLAAAPVTKHVAEHPTTTTYGF